MLELMPLPASSRAFSGPTNEVTIIDQINAMAELLDSPGMCVNDSFIVAGYTNPAHSNRQNEIWFLERPWGTRGLSSILSVTLEPHKRLP